MNISISFQFFYLALGMSFISCDHSDKHREEDKIFHAAPSKGGIGSLYFALYKDNTYEICNSGGVGQNCYSGAFILKRDTIIFYKLNKEIQLSSNRMIIKRYAEQDSTFWIWKYKISSNVSKWLEFKELDIAMGGIGDVYVLNTENEPLKEGTHFTIRMDSIKTYR